MWWLLDFSPMFYGKCLYILEWNPTPGWKRLEAWLLHPEKLTWNPTMEVWKMIVLFSWHVNFQGWGSQSKIRQCASQKERRFQVLKVLSIHDEFAIDFRHANFPTAVFASEFLRMFLAKALFFSSTLQPVNKPSRIVFPLYNFCWGVFPRFFSFFGGWVFSFPIHTSVHHGRRLCSVPVNRVDIWHTLQKKHCSSAD